LLCNSKGYSINFLLCIVKIVSEGSSFLDIKELPFAKIGKALHSFFDASGQDGMKRSCLEARTIHRRHT